MAWIKSHLSLERHPKLVELRVKMRWSKNETVGFLHRLWWTVLEYSPQGEISALSAEVMSEMLTVDLETIRKVLAAMQDIGWIDEHEGKLYIHDWWDYTGQYLVARYHTASPKLLASIKKLYQDIKGHGIGLPLGQPLGQPKGDPDKIRVEEIKKDPPLIPPKGKSETIPFDEILADFNAVFGTAYRGSEAIKRLIRPRWQEGHTLEDFKKVHKIMRLAWHGDEKMQKFLRPHTLYTGKFQSYLNYDIRDRVDAVKRELAELRSSAMNLERLAKIDPLSDEDKKTLTEMKIKGKALKKLLEDM